MQANAIALSLSIIIFLLFFSAFSDVRAADTSLTRVNNIGGLGGKDGVSMRVLWSVSGYKVGENTLWGEEEARRLLFKPLDMEGTTITFDGKTCRDVVFKRERVNLKEYLDHAYQTTARSIGIREEAAEVIKTNCDLPGFGEYLRLNDRRLVIHIKGVFFYLEPVINY